MKEILKLLYIYYPRLMAKSHCETHAYFIDKLTKPRNTQIQNLSQCLIKPATSPSILY